MWDAIVLGGMHWQNGMVGFGGELSQEQASSIHAFVIDRAHFAIAEAKEAQAAEAAAP